VLHGSMASDNSLAILTACYEDPADRDWAIATFRSLAHAPAE